MAQKRLDGSDIVAAFQEMSRELVPGAHGLADAGEQLGLAAGCNWLCGRRRPAGRKVAHISASSCEARPSPV